MEHYQRTQWLLYRENKLQPFQRESMEMHLKNCDQCLNTYLLLILPGDIEQGERIFSDDFNQRCLCNHKIKIFSSSQRLLQYYAVAAIVTFILMAGGWFDLLAQELPKTKVLREDVLSRVEEKIPYGWSKKLLDLTTMNIDKMVRVKEGKI